MKSKLFLIVATTFLAQQIFATSVIPDGSISTAKIADANVTLAKMASNSVGTSQLVANSVTAAKLAALNYGISSSSGVQTTTSASYVAITNMSVTITTTGRPVFVGYISDGSANDGAVWAGNLAFAGFAVYRDGSKIGSGEVYNFAGSGITSPCSVIFHIDTPSAGSHTYAAYFRRTSGSASANINYCKLVAYEL